MAHATWHPNGFMHNHGVIDFAGGNVVHIAAGCSGLMSSLVVGLYLSSLSLSLVARMSVSRTSLTRHHLLSVFISHIYQSFYTSEHFFIAGVMHFIYARTLHAR